MNAVTTGRTIGLASRIRRHPIPSFFVLALGISWIAWIPYVVSQNGLGLEGFEFPALLGTTQLLGVLPGAYLGPILAAFLVTAVTGGRRGVRLWTGRLLRWRVNWRWYALSLLGVPVVLFVTTLPFAGWENTHLPSAAVLAAYVPGLVLQMVTTGIAEEPGWRDFALPRLQPRYGPLRGTLILGPLWGVWHLPLFLTEWGDYPDVTWFRVAEFVVSCVAISVVMTWVFNRTGESLPLAMLLHTSVNNFASIAWASLFPTLDAGKNSTHVILIAFGVAALVLIAATRGRLGYSPVRDTAAPEAAQLEGVPG